MRIEETTEGEDGSEREEMMAQLVAVCWILACRLPLQSDRSNP